MTNLESWHFSPAVETWHAWVCEAHSRLSPPYVRRLQSSSPSLHFKCSVTTRFVSPGKSCWVQSIARNSTLPTAKPSNLGKIQARILTMEDLSVYHRFCCAAAWTENTTLIATLLCCTGPLEYSFFHHWAEIAERITSPPTQHPSNIAIAHSLRGDVVAMTKSFLTLTQIHPGELALYTRGQDNITFGILLRHGGAGGSNFDDMFVSLLLGNLSLFTSVPQPRALDTSSGLELATNAIVDLFDAHLRYSSEGDRWGSHGRMYFYERVHEFVRRGVRVEFCLPAFPCKSSNKEKVHGEMPDRGEQLALEHLHSFLEAVESIYSPGAKLWIVSDGHVFSDCIGVDDQVVDGYSAQLIRMNAEIIAQRGGSDRVGFKSLVDLFDLQHHIDEFRDKKLQLPDLPSHICTQRTLAAETSRRILLRGCRTADSTLRSRIESSQHSALKLYRGFSRFMTEDLAHNRYTNSLSRSKLRKLASKVAFEMMQRNEAYSNLVELLFPYHVRLSIHAHDNAGPKFGIRLFGPDVRAVKSLSSLDDSNDIVSYDLLHVPTPWHNCLVDVGGQPTLAMVKCKMVKNAMASGKFRGRWFEGGHHNLAGHFQLQPVKPKSTIAAQMERDVELLVKQYGNHVSCSFFELEGPADADMVFLRATIFGMCYC